jgi:hypothetical protein
LRTTLIQLAWLWLRNQPQSALALWFKDRVSRNGGRFKKTTIVALARRLLVALTGVAVTDLEGHEGVVFALTFVHSMVLTLVLGLMVAAQQYLIPGIIPSIGGTP